MMKVSLLDWFRTGGFGPLRLGQSRAEIQDVLGRPDVMSTPTRRHRTPRIWRYGDVELHFNEDDGRLWLIHLDNFGIPTGGHALQLAPWIIRGGLPRAEVERALTREGIDFQRADRVEDNVNLLIVGAGVTLCFAEWQEPLAPPPGLNALSQSALAGHGTDIRRSR